MNDSPNRKTGQMDDVDVELPLNWRVHRASEEPVKGILAIVIIIIAGILSAIFMDSLFWGIFAVVVLFFGLLRFFFPIEYVVDGSGIRENFIGIKRMAGWHFFKRAVVVGRDVLLSPYPKPTFMERFRGWQVRTPDEKTAAFLKKMVKR